MDGLAIDLAKPLSDRSYRAMVKKANKTFKRSKLKGVSFRRIKTNTGKTFNYIVY